MQRITDSTAAPSLPAPPSLSGLTPGYFTGGTPGSVAATRLRYWFLNMLQEELISLLTAADVTPDTTGTNFTQVLQALQTLFAPSGINNRTAVFTSNGTITVPAGVTKMLVSGCAGGAGANGFFSGGAGQSVIKQSVTVIPGDTLTISLGAGGAGTSATAAGSGGNTTITQAGTTLLTLTGATGATGGASSSTPSLGYPNGSGYATGAENVGASSPFGGGGGAAGTQTGTVGGNAGGYGAGGGQGQTDNGGNGTPGILILEW